VAVSQSHAECTPERSTLSAASIAELPQPPLEKDAEYQILDAIDAMSAIDASGDTSRGMVTAITDVCAAATWRTCQELEDRAECSLHLAVLDLSEDDAEKDDAPDAKFLHTHELDPPREPWQTDMGVAPSELAVTDVDEDGTPDVIMLYEITTEPQPAVGWTTHQVLVIMNPASGAVRYHAEVGRGGQATVHERCEWTARVVDPECAGEPELVLEQTCGEAWCFDLGELSEAELEDPDDDVAERLKECEPPETTVTRTRL